MNDRLTLMGMLAAGYAAAGVKYNPNNLAGEADDLIAADATRAPAGAALPAWVKRGARCVGRSGRMVKVADVAYDLALVHGNGGRDDAHTTTAEDFATFGAWPCDADGKPLAPETPR